MLSTNECFVSWVWCLITFLFSLFLSTRFLFSPRIRDMDAFSSLLNPVESCSDIRCLIKRRFSKAFLPPIRDFPETHRTSVYGTEEYWTRVLTLKRIKRLPSTLRRIKLKKHSNHLWFWICVWINLVREIMLFDVTSSFWKTQFSKCFLSTRKRKDSISKFLCLRVFEKLPVISITITQRDNMYKFQTSFSGAVQCNFAMEWNLY